MPLCILYVELYPHSPALHGEWTVVQINDGTLHLQKTVNEISWRALKEPPLIQKTVNGICNYCTTLEGDDCYSCWRPYFELKDLEKVALKADLERTIVESNGLTPPISSIHRSVSIYNLMKAGPNKEERAHKHMPDGLPKMKEETEEEEKEKMVDSPHTRLLRVMGRYPTWYTPLPDHQTD